MGGKKIRWQRWRGKEKNHAGTQEIKYERGQKSRQRGSKR